MDDAAWRAPRSTRTVTIDLGVFVKAPHFDYIDGVHDQRPDLDLVRLREGASRFADARLIVLFGSVASGTSRPWSDVDVGVIGVSLLRGGQIGAAIAALTGREPHVVDLDAASDHLRFEVARTGLLLHEAEPGTWARFQAEAALRWFDLAPIVALCRAGVERRLLRDARG